jgi:hypothetical protein
MPQLYFILLAPTGMSNRWAARLGAVSAVRLMTTGEPAMQNALPRTEKVRRAFLALTCRNRRFFASDPIERQITIVDLQTQR